MASKHLQLSTAKSEDSLTKYHTNYGEYSVDWRNIIFLPFTNLWAFLLMCSIYLNIMIIIYDVAYDDRSTTETVINFIYYFNECLYLLDTILSMAHRHMSYYREIREYQPINRGRLILDIFTLLPIYELYLLVQAASRTNRESRATRDVCRMLSTLRIYRVYNYFDKIIYNAGTNQILAVCVGHYLKVSLFTHSVGGLWYLISCWHCTTPNWTVNLRYHPIDSNNPLNWLVICYTTITNIFANNWRGNIRAETSTELLIIIIVMLSGQMTHHMILFGQLTRAYLKSFRRQFMFVQNMKNITQLLKDFEIKKNIRDKTIEFYSTFWERRNGIKNMPNVFLPAPLQKEVAVDIYWEALRHSHLFGTEDISYKRAISLEMKSEFYLAGDYVYRPHKVKHKMIYIASGILQVLAEEDQESPVISFSSGTILGEFSCLMPNKSNTNVRCATYCELQTLSNENLYRVLKNYPGKAKIMQAKLKERIHQAKFIKDYVMLQPKRNHNVFMSNTEDSSIKWLKHQWRHFANIHRSRKTEDGELKIDANHCSEYLNLLVLSDEVELKMEVICLKGSCPFIFEPNSSFRRFLRSIALLAASLQAIILPYNVAFLRAISPAMVPWLFIFDMVYFLDLYIKLSTAIKTKNALISEWRKIIIQRMKEVHILCDILATLPLNYFGLLLGKSDHIVALLNLNRLLKIYDVFRFMTVRENNLLSDNLNARLLKYFLIFGITCYWFTCLMYAFACFHPECYYYGWYYYNAVIYDQVNWYIGTTPFTSSWFYTISTYIAIGLSNRHPYVNLDILGHHSIVMLSYFVHSLCNSGLCATLMLRLEKRRQYREYIINMLEFLKVNNIRGKLKSAIMNTLQFWWYYNRNVEVYAEGGILEDATADLKDKILKQRIRECLDKVPLLSGCNDTLLNLFIRSAVLKTIPSGSTVVTTDYRPHMLNIILRGYCELTSTMAGDRERKSVTTLRPGDAFPCVEILHQVKSLVTVTTITAVEMISISYSGLQSIMIAHPSWANEIRDSLAHHFILYEGPLLQKKGRLPEMIPQERSLGQGDMFKYEIRDDDDENPEEIAYRKPFEKLGKLSFIRYLLLRKTIDPHKRFFLIWECFRCFCVILRVLNALTYYDLTIDYRNITTPVANALRVLCVLDFYVRAHCQYYNDDGILVTHPWSTTKHYFQTSFAIDFYSLIPLRPFKLKEFFGVSRGEYLYALLTIATCPWQMYRVIGLINYLETNVQRTSSALKGLKYAIILVVFLCITTELFRTLACRVRAEEKLTCYNTSWITTTYFKNDLRPTTGYLLSFYVSAVIFTTVFVGGFRFALANELIFAIGLMIATFFIRSLVYAKLISHRVGGNVKLTIYQERVKSFLNFVNVEYVDEDLIKDTIDHYQYMWKKTEGSSITHTLTKFHWNLHEEVIYSLYGSTLEAVDIFKGSDSSFYRHLGIYLEIQHFKKDAAIIRCNDVQGLFYIVYRGRVDITLAGSKLCTLGQGGVFGCFERRGITRQTISAIAKVHVELLAINSNKLNNIIKEFNKIKERFDKKIFLHNEYVESTKRVFFDTDASRSSTSSTPSANWFMKLYNKSKIIINPDDTWYKWWEYVINVHIATLSSIFAMFFIIMSLKEEGLKLYITIVMYLLDAVFVTKIYMGFHTAYEDSESGIIIKDHKMIRIRYFKSYRFWLDVLTCFPIEIFIRYLAHEQQLVKYGFGNRMFRWLHLILYYNNCQEKLNVSSHLRWIYLIYCLCVHLQFMTCLWWVTACGDDHCYHLVSTMFKDRLKFVKTESGVDSILHAYQYVVNLLTGTGLQEVSPMTYSQIGSTLIIMFVFQFTVIELTSQFATLLFIGQFTMAQYEYSIQQLKTYLQGQELSTPIVDKVWKYSLQLWQRQRGEWMPAIVTEAPSYLKQDLMTALYGHYLNNHVLFANTHRDFQRQLIVHFQRCVFFPGNYLAEKGDLDGSMYFIHDGDVEVFDKLGTNEMLREVLKKKRSFGETQGLFNVPHHLSYKARTVVDALILKHKDWQYLLEWFPASYEEILLRAKQAGFRNIEVQLSQMDQKKSDSSSSISTEGSEEGDPNSSRVTGANVEEKTGGVP